MPHIKIGKRLIGDDFPPVVIAELGINHGGSLALAIEMAEKAINAGAEIIKHQTHIIDDEMSKDALSIIPGNSKKSIYKIMEESALNEEEELILKNYIEDNNVIFISTPFSRAAVDRLVKFDIPAFKVGSGECNNYPLIKYIAQFNKPVIMSTGMNTIDSIKPSVDILRSKKIPFALLHCTNIYPTEPKDVRLNGVTILKNTFPDAVVGLSDHTTTNYPCMAAVALGASILERHFTDKKSRNGPDISCSMDPADLKVLIESTKIIHEAGGGDKVPLSGEAATIRFAYASVVAIDNIKVGEVLSENNIWVKRPGTGEYLADKYDSLLGKKAVKNISSGLQIKKSDIEC
jgi:N-acetylneuraminate synthase